MFGYIPPHGFRFQRKLNTITLVFIQLAVFVLLLALILKGDDNETYEDVHHEEGDDDDVDDVVRGDNGPEVVNWTTVFFIGVDGNVKQSGPTLKGRYSEEG